MDQAKQKGACCSNQSTKVEVEVDSSCCTISSDKVEAAEGSRCNTKSVKKEIQK